ncbi:nucleotide triphosphate diphosphatase NUDT15 [Ferrimonas gelatinilytica]|uniref:NUDIX hydrolase n=1 Tax=Ferrimonas gelatinilytica TaxID=1255257 RepID=A0ABP9RZW7_9GAMM
MVPNNPVPECHRPKVGIGILVLRPDGKLLLGKRLGSHAPFWSIPGGHLEAGETFEQCAIRELHEEAGLMIRGPKVVSVANNLRTFQQEGYHSVSVTLLAQLAESDPQYATNREPEKCEGWIWHDLTQPLPQPHFDASESAIHCYLQNRFYLPPSNGR